jgi:hypothetical protein
LHKPSTRRTLVVSRRMQRPDIDILRPSRSAHRDLHRILRQLPQCHDVTDLRWDAEHAAYTVAMYGPLAEGRRLAKPLVVLVQWDGSYWLISEPLFSNHAIGSTVPKAIKHFRRCLVDDFKFLDRHKGPMSQWLQDELEYFRSIIVHDKDTANDQP